VSLIDLNFGCLVRPPRASLPVHWQAREVKNAIWSVFKRFTIIVGCRKFCTGRTKGQSRAARLSRPREAIIEHPARDGAADAAGVDQLAG
jgi:hypothetical protein